MKLGKTVPVSLIFIWIKIFESGIYILIIKNEIIHWEKNIFLLLYNVSLYKY